MQQSLSNSYWKAQRNARAMGLAREYAMPSGTLASDKEEAARLARHEDPNEVWLALSTELADANSRSSLFQCLSFTMECQAPQAQTSKGAKARAPERVRFLFLRPRCSGVDALDEAVRHCHATGCARLVLVTEKALSTSAREIVDYQAIRMPQKYPDCPPLHLEELPLERLQFDPTLHAEFPIVRKLGPGERAELLRVSKFEPQQFPGVRADDPMCLWYGFVPGDFVAVCPKNDRDRPDFLVVGNTK